MINYSLTCSKNHIFEVWFRSSQDFEKQKEMGYLECPNCGDLEIRKALMTPAVRSSKKQQTKSFHEVSNASNLKKLDSDKKTNVVSGQDQIKTTLRMIRSYVEKNCENVGDNFAKEARMINEGSTEARGIYGKASKEEAEELIDEGIDLAAIPWIKDDS